MFVDNKLVNDIQTLRRIWFEVAKLNKYLSEKLRSGIDPMTGK